MMNNDDNWSDAECRYFIKLCTDEKKKGNKTKTGLNPTGKDSIIRKFEDRFGKRFVWDKFKNKYDVCRRAYQKFKNLIHNRTGVGYDAMGRIDMSDDWWNERFKLLRWMLDDDDDEYDDESEIVDNDRVIHRTDRGAGWRHVQQLMYGSDQQCYDTVRMNQRSFAALCSMLTTRYGLQENNNVFAEEGVAIFLEMVGQDKTIRSIAERYQRSVDTVKRKFDEVLSAVLRFGADTLKPGEGEFTRVSSVLRNDDRYWPYFKDCIGALDGTHIPVRPPTTNAEAYRGRKMEPTMNVLAICNFDMKFIYAYVGVPGRAHDTKVLTHCAKNEVSFPHPPNGKYYLVDSGYPTRTGYLGPHRSVRYHLDQFVRGGPPTNMRELFNRKHSGLRSIIERTFGVWKAKWRILDRKHPKYGLAKWMKIVTATMALHNFIRESNREDYDFVHWQRTEEYHIHGDEDEDDDDDDDDDRGGHIPYEPTGDRAMEGLRETITSGIGRGCRLPY